MGFSKANADKIRMSTGDWLPYIGISNDPKGYVNEITEIIFKQAGHEILIINLPFPRALAEFENGKIELLSCATIEDVNLQKVVLTDESIGVYDKSFFTLKGNPWRYTGMSSLINIKKLGIVKGEAFPEIEEFIKKYEKTKIHYLYGSDGYMRLLKMLEVRRVDVIVDNRSVVLYNASKIGLTDKIKLSGSLDRKSNLWHAFSLKHPKAREYAVIFSEGLREIRDSGELNKILEKYGLKDWK